MQVVIIIIIIIFFFHSFLSIQIWEIWMARGGELNITYSYPNLFKSNS